MPMSEVFRKLKVLKLTSCRNITSCPDFSCIQMPHLQELNFSGCVEMSGLHPSVGLLKSLTHLNLSLCKSVKKLPEEIYELSSLEELDLMGCSQITCFPSWLRDSKSLRQHLLGKLKVLILNGCENLTICPDFMSMPHLKILDFPHCDKITELHPSIGQLKSLICLDLRYCKSLKGLPQKVWQLISLQELNFRGCSNVTCPDFTSMPLLKRLNFSDCDKVTELHPSILQLKSLCYLHLMHCKSLKELPQEFGQLTSLKELHLHYCSQISTLPDSMRHLKQLELLHLDDCSSLQEVPKCIMSLDQLYKLTVSGCTQLKFLPQLPSSLTELDANNCHQLEMIADVSNIKGLRELNLCGCKGLVDIPGLEQLKCLRSLKLGGCRSLHLDSQFERVQMLDVSSAEGLEVLDLTGWVKLVDVPSIEHLKGLCTLMLGGCRNLQDSFLGILQDANFQYLERFSISGRLMNGGSSCPKSIISFPVPKWFTDGLLFLHVNESTLANIRLELGEGNVSKQDDKSIGSEEHRNQLDSIGSQLADKSSSITSDDNDCQSGRSVVRADITTDDARFSLSTFFNEWNKGIPTAKFGSDNEMMIMVRDERFKGNDDDAQGTKAMMMMHLSIDHCALLHGDLFTIRNRSLSPSFIAKLYFDLCEVGHQIVMVRFLDCQLY